MEYIIIETEVNMSHCVLKIGLFIHLPLWSRYILFACLFCIYLALLEIFLCLFTILSPRRGIVNNIPELCGKGRLCLVFFSTNRQLFKNQAVSKAPIC